MPDNAAISIEIQKLQNTRGDRASISNIIPYYVYGSKTLNYAFSNIQLLYSKFIGAPHFRHFVRVLGYSGIALLIEELLNLINNKIQSSISLHVTSLKQLMTGREGRLLNTTGGSNETFSALKAIFKKIIENNDAKMRIFQDFREMGNALLFCLHIEQALSQEEVCDLLQSFPFQKVFPHLYLKDVDKPESKLKRLEIRYASLHVVSNIEKYGTKNVKWFSFEISLVNFFFGFLAARSHCSRWKLVDQRTTLLWPVDIRDSVESSSRTP